MQHYGGDAMTWRLIRITRLALRSNNDRTGWKLLDLLVEQIGAEHHWIKVKQLFEYQTYFARYIICCKCVENECWNSCWWRCLSFPARAGRSAGSIRPHHSNNNIFFVNFYSDGKLRYLWNCLTCTCQSVVCMLIFLKME